MSSLSSSLNSNQVFPVSRGIDDALLEPHLRHSTDGSHLLRAGIWHARCIEALDERPIVLFTMACDIGDR
jgi:hypothetical protein